MEEKNISRGAEKVEKIARGEAGAAKGREREELQAAAAGGGAGKAQSVKKTNRAENKAAHEKAMAEKIERENERARSRVAAAEAKKKEKEERALRKQEQQRAREAHAAEARRHRREERAARKAKRAESKKQRAPGFGGWLAAVVSLSVAVLALGAIVTVGYFDLTQTRSMVETGYRTSVYEFSEIVERMDAELAKARVASGSEMRRVLTDILVDSELAELCVEHFPVDGHAAESVTAFLNRTGEYARALLRKVNAGQALTAEEREAVEYMYTCIGQIRAAMPGLVESAQSGVLDKMMLSQGDFSQKFEEMAGSLAEVPENVKGFADEKIAGEALQGEAAISESEAAQRAGEIFKDYAPKEMRAAGKTENRGLVCYNFEFSDAQGRSYFAQITEKGGKLAFFDSYEPCDRHNYDARNCVKIAEKFLAKCGYEELRPVWLSEAGSECTVDFACVQGGAVVYADRIKVKVCTERGIVTGVEAHPYLLNHHSRTVGEPALSKAKVERNARERMDELHGVRPALLPEGGKDVLCWEIRGEYGGRMYIAFVDASTGDTLRVYTVSNTDRGMAVV